VSDVDADAPRRRDPAGAFARLSRAVRLTLALEARTDQALRDLKAGIEPERQEARARAAERAHRAGIGDRDVRHDQVFNLVFDAAKAEIDDHEAFGEVFEALVERMEEDEGYVDLRERPLREIVERLCRDLDLSPDWSQWRDDGWAPGYSPARFRFSPFNRPSRRPLNAELGSSSLWKPARSRTHALE
jgi:hypothetical protein